MSGVKGHRAWGNIKRQKTREPSYQASYIGPDLRRHYAPTTFTARMNAERWLAREKDYKDSCLATGETWKPPRERALEKKAEVLRLSQYGKQVIDQRILKPRTRIEYEALWAQVIEPKLGALAVRDLTTTAVRAWHSGLNPGTPTRNSHAYGVLSMICNTAVRDGLLQRSPCQVVGAMSSKPKKKVKALSVVEVHAIADKLGAESSYPEFKALVLLSAWCGLRFGEVSELRRKDIRRASGAGEDCSVVSLTRAVTHREQCRIDTTKTSDERSVVIPPHIRADVREHLANYVSSEPDSLLFRSTSRCGHLSHTVFSRHFKAAAKSVGRHDLSAHDLRRFAGSENTRVATLTENMKRLGHKTVDAALRYQHSQDGRDAIVAAALSANALAELAAAPEHTDEN